MRLSEPSDNLRSFLLGSGISDRDLFGEIMTVETGYNDDYDDLEALMTQEPAVVCHWRSLEHRRRHKCVASVVTRPVLRDQLKRKLLQQLYTEPGPGPPGQDRSQPQLPRPGPDTHVAPVCACANLSGDIKSRYSQGALSPRLCVHHPPLDIPGTASDLCWCLLSIMCPNRQIMTHQTVPV